VADAAVLASGSGSNFEALAEALAGTGHRIRLLVCDQKDAGCLQRAERLGIPSRLVSYAGRTRREAEKEILEAAAASGARILFLAGFMRLLTPFLIDGFPGDIINIHPALLPRHPGTHGIRDSYLSQDPDLGITIHKVDYGMDTGPVIRQASFPRTEVSSLEEAEVRIHQLEHLWYPRVALELLEALEGSPRRGAGR